MNTKIANPDKTAQAPHSFLMSRNQKYAVFCRNHLQSVYRESYLRTKETAIPYEMNDRVYRINEHARLYLDVTSKCTGNCSFCLAKSKYPRPIVSPDIYITSLHRSLDLVGSFDPPIQITGGEPALSDTFLDIIQVVNARRIRKPLLNTNGSGLTDNVIACLHNGTPWAVNCSRHHYNEDKHGEIMRQNPPLPNAELSRRLSGLSARLQCNLLQGGIDSADECLKFIDKWFSLGVRAYAFAELSVLPMEGYNSNDSASYCDRYRVSIFPIVDVLAQRDDWTFIQCFALLATYYELWQVGDCWVTFKRADHHWLSRIDAVQDMIPDFVLHTDGTLTGSWNKEIKKLLGPGRREGQYECQGAASIT